MDIAVHLGGRQYELTKVAHLDALAFDVRTYLVTACGDLLNYVEISIMERLHARKYLLGPKILKQFK